MSVDFVVLLLQAAVALLVAQEQIRLLKAQVDIAKKYYIIYKEQRAFYRAVFQRGTANDPVEFRVSFNTGLCGPSAGAELQFLNEVFGLTAYQPAYTDQRFQALNRNSGALVSSLSGFNRKIRRYRVSAEPQQALLFQLSASESLVDSINYWFRYEEHFKEVDDERMFDRKMQVSNMGLKRGNASLRGLAVSFDMYSRANNRLAGIYGSASNSMLRTVGFSLGRKDANRLLDGGPQRLGAPMAGEGKRIDWDTSMLAPRSINERYPTSGMS